VTKEWDKPLIIAMRLKVINGKITGIEHVLARNIRTDRMQNLVIARLGLLADVNDNDRTPRQVMIDAADSYFESIDPFADDCERHENGGQTTHNVIPMGGGTSNLQAREIFKIRNGKIHEIEAMGVSLSYGTKSPWE
jgi:hypothetical protein